MGKSSKEYRLGYRDGYADATRDFQAAIAQVKVRHAELEKAHARLRSVIINYSGAQGVQPN